MLSFYKQNKLSFYTGSTHGIITMVPNLEQEDLLQIWNCWNNVEMLGGYLGIGLMCTFYIQQVEVSDAHLMDLGLGLLL